MEIKNEIKTSLSKLVHVRGILSPLTQCLLGVRAMSLMRHLVVPTGTDPENTLRDAFAMFDESGKGQLSEEL